MAKVFVSYSRKDIEFAKRLTTELKKSELDFWIDWEGIPPTVDWWREIEKGIEEADAFLFLISPDSARSKVCRQEIETAVKNGKRIIPIVVREIEWEDTPPQLGHLNYIFFSRDDDFDTAVRKLLTAVQTDYEWAATHRRLQVKALEWERNNKENSFLLRGKDLQEAEFQLATNTSKEPYPTNLQRKYVFASRKSADKQRNITIGISIAGVIALAALAVWGWGQAGLATINANNSDRNASTAQAASTLAFNNAATADANQQTAQAASTLAVANEQDAIQQAKIALARQWAAEANSILASPNGNVEAAALLSVRALQVQQDKYLQAADETLSKSLNRLYTTKVFNQHDSQVSSVAYSPNGNQILIGYIDGTAQLYDVQKDTGTPFSGIYGYFDLDNDPTLMGIHAVAFSQNSEYFLIAGSDGYIQIWNQNLELIQEIHAESLSYLSGQQRQDLLWSAEFSPDGKYVLIGKGWPFEGPGKIEIWEIRTGQLLFSFPQIHERHVTHAEFSQDGSLIFSTSYDGTAILWDINWITHTATPRQKFEPNIPIRDGALSPDGKMILLGLETSVAKLFRTDGSPVRNFVGHTGTITSVSFSPKENYILTASLDNTARLWDIDSGYVVRIFSDHTNDIWTAVFSPNGDSILTGSYDNTARLWNADLKHDSRIIYGHNDSIIKVSFSPDGKSILSSSKDDSVRLWNATTLEQESLDISTSLLDPIAVFSDQGRWIAISGGTWVNYGGTDLKLVILEKQGKEYKVEKIITQDKFVQALAFSNHNNKTESEFLYLGRDNPSRFLLQAGGSWQVKRTYEIGFWNHDAAMTQSVQDNQQYLAVAGDPEIQIYQINGETTLVTTCKTVGDARGHPGSKTVAFSQDGKYLASQMDNIILIWDWQINVNECTQLEPLRDHLAPVTDLAFSPDKNYLLSGSSDGTAILWDAKTWKKIRVLAGHDGDVTSVAFSPDSKFIVTGSSDKIIRIWDTDYKDTINLVCSILDNLQRDFTDSERKKYGITDKNPTCGN